MGKVTYPDAQVIEFINSGRFVPLLTSFDHEPQATDWRVRWTPMLFILEPGQFIVQRNVGFLPPEEFIPWVTLGMAKTAYNQGKFVQALDLAGQVLDKHGACGSAPEAVYLAGISGYRHTHQVEALKQASMRLSSQYPQSLWAKRASPYSLL